MLHDVVAIDTERHVLKEVEELMDVLTDIFHEIRPHIVIAHGVSPEGDGTDSVHSLGGRIYYGYGVTVLHTDDPDGLSGDGLGFTLGAGTDMVCAAIGHLAKPLVGREVEELMAEWEKQEEAIDERDRV